MEVPYRRTPPDEVGMPRKPFSILLLILALVTVGAGLNALSGADPEGPKEKAPAQGPSFQDDIQPLFQMKCWRCHGEKVRKADLDLTTLAGALKGGESGPAI